MTPLHVEKTYDENQDENVEFQEECIDNSAGNDNVMENRVVGVVENSDILIINHDEENDENISYDDIDADSDAIDYNNSIWNKSATAISIVGVEERIGSANKDESVLDDNDDLNKFVNGEPVDAIELKPGTEATESADEVDQEAIELGAEECINIGNITESTMHGSAVSRISLRSANSASVTPKSAEDGIPPHSVRSQSQSYGNSHTASASSQHDSVNDRSISASQTQRQTSVGSQMSRYSITEPVGNAISRKTAKSVEMSAPLTPGSARSRKSNVSGSARSETSRTSNVTFAETGLAEGDDNEIDRNGYVNVIEDEIEDAAETMQTDVMSAETDAQNNDNLENNDDIENKIAADATSDDDIETAEKVNLYHFCPIV